MRYTGGSVARGYARQGVRRMQGPPAALYPRAPTNATAMKSVDAPDQTIVLNTTASPNVLVVPETGGGFFNRLGNRTRGVSLQIRGTVAPTFSNAATLAQGRVRIVIYYDRQSNAANPTISDILADTDNGGSTNTDVQSMVNISNRDRFVILRDRYIVTPEIGVNGGASPLVGAVFTDPNGCGKTFKYEEFIKLKGLESCYNSSLGGGIANISAGAFGILAFSDDASGDEAWQFLYSVRFKFLD